MQYPRLLIGLRLSLLCSSCWCRTCLYFNLVAQPSSVERRGWCFVDGCFWWGFTMSMLLDVILSMLLDVILYLMALVAWIELLTLFTLYAAHTLIVVACLAGLGGKEDAWLVKVTWAITAAWWDSTYRMSEAGAIRRAVHWSGFRNLRLHPFDRLVFR